jgi:signal transduction histidine kinase
MFSQPAGNLPLYLVANLLPLGIYVRFPQNGVFCAIVAVCVMGVLVLTGRYEALTLAGLALVAIAVGMTGCLTGYYRESIIPLQRYVNRLEENVSSLTRANSLTQDYARDVEEESRVAERQRLTRDIHDAIGYTLTNTIMAMEAVKMMVRGNPERVPEHLEAARKNTEEGLANIKRILRDFRNQTRVAESCFRAIRKLVKVFALSTGMEVRFEFGNADVAALDPVGECAYHFVQEGLINAFRHGRAERVTILLWDYGDTVRITLDDDGTGSPEQPTSGIGIAGMRERAALVGGRVQVDHHVGGFRISMHLPKVGGDGRRE